MTSRASPLRTPLRPVRERRLVRSLALAAAPAAGILIVFASLPRSVPLGIVGLGLVIGSLNALFAVGLILIYRTSRIINFAQAELGAFAAVLGVELIAGPRVPFLVALVTVVVAAAAAGAAVDVLIVRRFARAPRLILTVATIGLAQIFAFGELQVVKIFTDSITSSQIRTPFSGLAFTVHPIRFTGDHLVAIAALPLLVGGIGLFLTRTSLGVAVRAAAENAERAALSGVPIRRVSLVVWVVASVLSALAAFLRGPVIGLTVGSLIGPGLLVRALAAAVVARMQSIPVAVAASLGLGVLEQGFLWSLRRAAVVEVVVFSLIIVGLVFQKKGSGRSEEGRTSTWQLTEEMRPLAASLRRLPEVVWGRVAVYVLGTAAVLAVAVLASPSQANLLSTLPIFALVGLSLVILTGWAGQVSLGQFALVGVGAAVGATLTADYHWDFLLAMLAGGLSGSAAALAVGATALRVRGFFLAVSTLAFAMAAWTYLFNRQFAEWLLPDATPTRPVLLRRFDLESERVYFVFCAAIFVIAALSARALRTSRTGRVLIAQRDNERAAQSYGVDAVRAKLLAFSVSGFIAGVAGVLYAHHQHAVATASFSPIASLEVFAMATIGGLGSIGGAVLGAAYVRGVQRFWPGPGEFLASGTGLLLLLLFLPGGLGGLLVRARDALMRVIAARRGLQDAVRTEAAAQAIESRQSAPSARQKASVGR